jgi:ABC-type bacteriocin/lantibiotic exporter with double-glycine peptidase domain
MAEAEIPTNKWFSRVQIRKVITFLGPKTVSLLLTGVAVGLVTVFVELVFAYSLQGLLLSLGLLNRDLSETLPKWMPTTSLASMLGILFSVGIIRGLLSYIQTFTQGAVVEEFKFFQRTRLLQWVFHSESVSSSEVNLLFNDHIHTAGSEVLSIQTLITQATLLTLLGAFLLKLSIPLTLILGTIIIPSGLLIRRVSRKTRTLGEAINREWIRTSHQLTVSIRNLLLMQLYGTQAREEERAQSTLSAYVRHYLSYFRLLGLQTFVPQVFGFMSICLICYGGKELNLLSATGIIAYLYVFMRFLQGGAILAQSFSNAILYWPQMALTAKWWADSAHDGVRGARHLIETVPIVPSANPVGWSLRAVEFRYPDSVKSVISNFDLEIKPGSTTVITGSSGSGKSTLLHLLLGLITPTSGKIEVKRYDSVSEPLADFRSALLRSVGYVGPESFLIEGTVLENLNYGSARAPNDEELREALELAECQFIFNHPQGLQLELTEQGHGLSAGQKQRISLARALLRKPKVLILDEATSNLDDDVESKLISTLAKLKSKMTIVAVTHRKRMLDIADQEVHL